jgi:hypothetical protein
LLGGKRDVAEVPEVVVLEVAWVGARDYIAVAGCCVGCSIWWRWCSGWDWGLSGGGDEGECGKEESEAAGLHCGYEMIVK